MDRAIFWRRIARLRSFLSQKGLDAAWVVGSENRRYLSGFRPQDTLITESSGSLLLGQDYAILITDPRYQIEAKEDVPDFELKIIRNNQVRSLCQIMIDAGVKAVGFEEDYVSFGLYNEIKEEFKRLGHRIELLPLDNIVEKMREIKDEYEIMAIKGSANMICSIMEELKRSLRSGMKEMDLAFKVRELAHMAFAEDLSFPPIVASGPNSALPHAIPGKRPLLPNEPIIVDIGVKVNGYCSDITRTLFMGELGPEFKRVYSVVERAQSSAIEAARAGIKSAELDAIARNIIKEAGYGDYFTHGLGHGVGLAVHERPRVSKTDSTILKAGMIITIEPGIYIPDKGGVRLEEMVLVKEDGSEVITKG